MDDEMKSSMTNTETWWRGVTMLLFAIIYSLAELLVVFIAIFHFVATLFTRRPMENLMDFGDDLSIYMYEILQYVTYNSDEKPFPFGPWPNEDERPRGTYDDSDDATYEDLSDVDDTVPDSDDAVSNDADDVSFNDDDSDVRVIEGEVVEESSRDENVVDFNDDERNHG